METLYRAGLSNAVSATVLALLVACLGRILGRRPALLHCLWLLVLLKLVTPPLYTVTVPWPASPNVAPERESNLVTVVLETEREDDQAPQAEDVDADLLSDTNIPPPEHPRAGERLDEWRSIDWMRMASAIWIAGVVTTIVISIRRIQQFRRLLKQARPATEEIQEWVDELAANLGLGRSPSVWWIDGKLSPLVWFLGGRPRLIVPTTLWKGLDDRQREALIIHELAHLRRGDHRVRLFELLVTALYWWHPVLWWARQALRDVEEQCCDAWVVWAIPDAARSYAETLLETLDFLHQSDLSEPLLASGFGKVHHLRKRLTMIMSGTTPRMLGVWGTLGSLGLAAALLPLSATWAQEAKEKNEINVVVADDDHATESLDLVTVTLDDASNVLTETIQGVEVAKPGRAETTVTFDNFSATAKARSLEQAIGKLKEQIKELDKEPKPSNELKAQKRALERVIKELEAVGKNKPHIVVTRPLPVPVQVQMPKVRDAEIEKIQAKVKTLSEELHSKQKELRDAHSKLAKLVAEKARTITQHRPVTIRPVTGRGLEKATTTVRREPAKSDKRLDALEQKLEKLLEEVASLKKDRAK